MCFGTYPVLFLSTFYKIFPVILSVSIDNSQYLWYNTYKSQMKRRKTTMTGVKLNQNFKSENNVLKRVQGNFFLDTFTCSKLGIPQEELNQCNSVYLLHQPKLVKNSVKGSLRWLNTISDYLNIESLILQQPDCEMLLTAWADVNDKHTRYSYWDGSVRKGVLPPSGTADLYLRFLRNQVEGKQLHDFLHSQDSSGLTMYAVLMWSGSITRVAPPNGFILKNEKTLRTLKRKGLEKGFAQENFGFPK